MRIISFSAAALTLVIGLVIAGGSGTSTAVAQSPPPPGVPAFAAVPRFTTGRLRAAALGAPQQNGTACNPGTAHVNGRVVSLDLRLRRVDATIDNPSGSFNNKIDPLTLRTYSGCLTSPAIDAFPGDSLRIALHNDLSPNDPTCGASPAPYLQLPSGVGCFNTTNFHSHGLHVSPSGISDNVLRDMPPAASPYPIRIDIPADHPAGTFWYHAHMHGSTAVQVSSADAGVLVVHGNRKYNPAAPLQAPADIDTILHDVGGRPFPDTVFVLQQIAYACFWTTDPNKPYDNLITSSGLYTTNDANSNNPPPSASAPWTCNPGYQLPPGKKTRGVVENFDSQLFSPSIWDTNGRFTSINGVVQPRLTVPAGQIQRWRFVHAGVHDTINLQIVRMTPSAAAVPLATQLAGKTRKQQAAVVQQSCSATAATLIPQLEIAVDGLTRTKIDTVDPPGVAPLPIATAPPAYPSNYLQPGYRSDVLVAFPREGDYCLLDQAAPPSERVNNGGGGGQGPSIPQLLAYVHVAGGHSVSGNLQQYVERTLYAANPDLPANVRTPLLAGTITPWAAFPSDLPQPSPHPEPYARFQIDDSNGAFTVNGQSYDPNTVQPVLVRQLGTIDDWHVEIAPQFVPTPTPVPSGQPAPSPAPTPQLDLGEPHIFHIHINPFQIVDVRRRYYDSSGKLVRTASIYDQTGKCIPSVVAGDSQHLADQYCGLWHVYRDTLFIENSFEVVLRTHYVRYTGEFVLHCHILDHEDAGMMANVQIVTDVLHPPKPAQVHMPTMHRMKH